ncbi:exported hypothetical protein [Desulfarculales bacterium]
MKNCKKIALAVYLTAALAVSTFAQAAEKSIRLKESDTNAWSVDLTLPYYSKFLSRGALTVEGPVLQPGTTVAGYGFSFNVWVATTSPTKSNARTSSPRWTLPLSTPLSSVISASPGRGLLPLPQ